jgi:hypothetical protein
MAAPTAMAGPSPATAAREPVAIATCSAKAGQSKLELVPITGEMPVLRAELATPKGAWKLEARVGLVRAGAATRTIAVEDLKLLPGNAATSYKTMPTQLTLDLFLDTKKLNVRHASEGAPDPHVALDLTGCVYAETLDASLAGLGEATEAAGCEPALLGSYAKQLAPLQLPPADAARDARTLCEAHQPVIAAGAALEQRLADAAARRRATSKRAAHWGAEDLRQKAWAAIDACLAKAAPTGPLTLGTLLAAEDKTRACYAAAGK